MTPRLPISARSNRRSVRRPSRQAGFTLIELMIVIVLVGISAAMIAPAVQRTMAISRANRCTYDVARLLRRARGEAIGTGRAHLVVMEPVATDFRFRVFIGDSSSCARSDWTSIIAGNAIDNVLQSSYDAGGNGVYIRVTDVGGPAPRHVCFEPDGERFHRSGIAGPFQRSQSILTVTIDRHEQGTAGVDVLRQIVIPQFGVARVVR